MRKRRKYTLLQYLSFILYACFALCCIICYGAKLLNCQSSAFTTLLPSVTTGLAVVILVYALFTFVCRPITVDRIISSNRWMFVVAIFLTILTVPISIEFAANKAMHKGIIAEELVYDPNVYYDPSIDIAHTTTEYQYVRDNDSTFTLTTANNRFEQSREAKRLADKNTVQPSSQWAIWYHFVDPGNQHMTTTHRGRMLSMLISLLGTLLLSGILVSILTNLLDRRAQAFAEGTRRYNCIAFRFRRGHIIIFGGHHSLVDICKEQLERSHHCPNIFILTKGDVGSLRSNIISALGKEAERHIVIYKGCSTDSHEVNGLFPSLAKEFYILGEESESADHDIVNMQTLKVLSEVKYPKHIHKHKKCYLQFEYQSAFSALQSAATPGEISHALEFIPYNFYENWAQKVLVNNAYPDELGKSAEAIVQSYKNNENYRYVPLDGEGIGYDDPETVHLVIFGMSKMGVALAIEAAHIAHYPNFVKDHSKRTTITFVDPDIDKQQQFFKGRFKYLFKEQTLDFLDIRWDFRKGGVEDNEIQQYLSDCCNDSSQKLTVAICLDQPHEAISASLYLPQVVYEKAQQILVYQHTDSAIIDIVNGRSLFAYDEEKGAAEYIDKLRYSKLRPFGMCSMSNRSLPRMRMLAHAASKIYDFLGSEGLNTLFFVDDAKQCCETAISKNQEEWVHMKLWSQWSNIYNINTIDTKMRSIRASQSLCTDREDPFSELHDSIKAEQYQMKYNVTGEPFHNIIENDIAVQEQCTPQQKQLQLLRVMSIVEHNRWNTEKLLMGYRPFTSEEVEDFVAGGDRKKRVKNYKDNHVRAHQCICSFSDLYKRDPDTVDYDVAFTLMLPYLEKLKETLNNR